MFGDVFGDILVVAVVAQVQQGADLRYDLQLDLEDAVKGKPLKLMFQGQFTVIPVMEPVRVLEPRQ